MQTDQKQPANKLAMSRALGAAFLSHQVEQLEKSVGKESRGTASNNWRERNMQTVGGRGGKRGGAPNPHTHPHHGGRKRERKDDERSEGKDGWKPREQKEHVGEADRKDADTVVVDASVLVYGLGQLKKWCRDGRQEEIVIPLEALNTLDLLKKGSSLLAQRARTASRILEAQVGTNPRIRVQRDEAFVLWDDVLFSASNPTSKETSPPADTKTGSSFTVSQPGNTVASLAPPPEWLRRTICCGAWEALDTTTGSATAGSIATAPAALATLLKLSGSPPTRSSTPISAAAPSSGDVAESNIPSTQFPATYDSNAKKKVVFAVVTQPNSPAAPSSLDASTSHPGKYERVDGILVRVWAQRAGLEVLDVKASAPLPAASTRHTHPSPETRRPHQHGGPDRREFKDEAERERKPSLVEKPIAMTIVNDQPVKILRVLARGEKLDP